MTSTKKKHKARRGKARSLRKRLRARTDHPRLSVFRSLSNISVQVIDDLKGQTVAAASSPSAPAAVVHYTCAHSLAIQLT